MPLSTTVNLQLPTSATGAQFYINGKPVTATRGPNGEWVLPGIIGPKDVVTVIALGNDGTASEPTVVPLSSGQIPLANVNFASNQAGLTSAAKKVLDKTIAAIIAHGFTSVSLVGHTDNAGGPSANVGLSDRRAKSVYAYIVKRLKAAGVKITTAGKAEADPVASNSTAAGMANNRRVEIVVKR